MKYEQMTLTHMIPQTATTGKTTAEKLRERMQAENGFEHFDDVDTLTAIIGLVNQTEKAPRIADKLLDTFGSLKGVLEARPEQLKSVSGVGEKMAFLISAVVPLVRVWNREAMRMAERIGNSREAESYCKSLLIGRRTEAFYVVALNAKCNVLGARKISEGSLSEVSAYPRMELQRPFRIALPQPPGRNLRPQSGRHCQHNPTSAPSERGRDPRPGSHHRRERPHIQHDSARGHRLQSPGEISGKNRAGAGNRPGLFAPAAGTGTTASTRAETGTDNSTAPGTNASTTGTGSRDRHRHRTRNKRQHRNRSRNRNRENRQHQRRDRHPEPEPGTERPTADTPRRKRAGFRAARRGNTTIARGEAEAITAARRRSGRGRSNGATKRRTDKQGPGQAGATKDGTEQRHPKSHSLPSLRPVTS